ncbi:hypothetical protein ASD83_12485 [Devosia sp. Root685]|uniref:hypothetical protein n=1 Tax=Devosia sp. Root685 TaxID=1736587 RepID=UPI0006F891F0|nr:hypothetical protein [Devosia sp. Root685]KRA97887.1 hypothetical protein ASD83_12485 [Devosia sp. Root685]
MKTYRVVALAEDAEAEVSHITLAATPEGAAAVVLGLDLVRGASKGAKPVAKIYWEGGPQQLNMVRLYTRLGAR